MQTHVYRDFDAFADDVRDVDCVMLLQNPQKRLWTIGHAALPSIRVQLGRLGSGNIVEGQSWPGGYMIYLPLTDECAYAANGTILDKNSFMILEPGCEFCISTKSEHDWCTIVVPSSVFANDSNLIEPLAPSDRTSCRVTQPNFKHAARFSRLVHAIMGVAAKCRTFESSLAAANVESELVKVASSIVGARKAPARARQGRPKLARQQIVQRSQELLEARGPSQVSVIDLAVASGVSERTLRTAFVEYYGVSPVRYLQLCRLHGVYRTLLAAEPNTVSVAEVLVKSGEWEFGRFASRYSEIFGELPSATLRRYAR